MDMSSADRTIERQEREVHNEYKGIEFRSLISGITTHPLIRGGRPCIEGTGLKVTDIVVQQKNWHQTPVEIAKHFDIKVSQVEDALNYYAAHTDYIDTDIELDTINDDQFAEAQYGTRPDSILSRRKSVARNR